MRERVVDSVLLAALGIVCVLIVFALFSPASLNFFRSNPTQEVTTPDTSEVAENDVETNTESDTADATPVIPSEGADSTVEVSGEGGQAEAATDTATDASTTETSTNEAASTGAEAESAETEDAATGDTATSEAETETTEPAAATGSVQLERIGFSFVTGNAHACGVVLEAWEHVAVSRDLLERYPCGSEITLTLDEPVNGRSSVTAVVGDTMNPDNVNTVNIYVGTDEPAQTYGVQTGQLSAP